MRDGADREETRKVRPGLRAYPPEASGDGESAFYPRCAQATY